MSRWKSVSIVLVPMGVVAIGLMLRPKPEPTGQPVAASQTAPVAQNRPPERETKPAPAAARAVSSSVPVKPAQAQVSTPREETAGSGATQVPSPSTTPADPLAVTTAVAATPAAGASVEPAVTPTVAASAPQPQASASKSVTVVVKKDTVIGIRIDQLIASDSAHVDDKITAKVSRDVVVDGITAIPAGTRVEGVVTMVERPTQANPRGKLGVRFASIVRPDNTRVAITTETIYREASDSSASNGAAYDVNAFTAVVSGSRSTPPPAGRSGAGSAASSPKPKAREAQLPAGAPLTLHLTAALSVTVDRDPQ